MATGLYQNYLGCIFHIGILNTNRTLFLKSAASFLPALSTNDCTDIHTAGFFLFAQLFFCFDITFQGLNVTGVFFTVFVTYPYQIS